LLKRNLIANYIGQGWRFLISLAFVPLYIKYLGVEAYGLIGIFAMLQAWLGLLDMGMKPALGREMARFSAGANGLQSIWDLLRSVEIIFGAIAVLVSLAVWLASGWLAADWVRAEKLPIESVAQAFVLMGAVTSLQFVESIYTSTLAGLQRQVLQNGVASLMVTVRALGAVGVLAWVSPTISAFFMWQGLISLASVAFFASATYRALPAPPRRARFSLPSLTGIWTYAAGMTGITLMGIMLTQIDKLMLTRLLTLESFGFYALAGLISGSLYALTSPVVTAVYPRLAELVAKGDSVTLCRTYHQGAQLVTVVMGSAAIVLMTQADQMLQVWTGDDFLTKQVAPLVIVLALGTLLNGLSWIPFQLQFAYGWTSLALKINVVAVLVLIPAIVWVVPRYGAIGAAWIWVAVNAGYVFIAMHFMHRRVLQNEKWTWYREDIFMPLVFSAVTALAMRWAMPELPGRVGGLFRLIVCALMVLAAASLSAPLVKAQLAQSLRRIWPTIRP
jgi:O-antigen/teichoic acid export membrane protein